MHKICFSSVRTSILVVRVMGFSMPIPLNSSPFLAKRMWNGGFSLSLSKPLMGIMVFIEARL